MKRELHPLGNEYVSVTMACSDSYKSVLGVLLESIVENSAIERMYDIVVLEYDMSQNTMMEIKKYYERANISIRFFDISGMLEQYELFCSGRLSVITYARLLIPDIFSDFARVIYVDCDTICLSDIAQLYDVDMQEKEIYAMSDIVMNMEAWHNPNSIQTQKYMNNVLKIHDEGTYFNGGVIVFDISNLKYSTDELLTVAEEQNWIWADQDVLNYLYNGEICYGEISWNYIVVMNYKQRRKYLQKSPFFCHYEEAGRHPNIIHFADGLLPCDRKRVPFEMQFWEYAKKSLYYDKLKGNSCTKFAHEVLDIFSSMIPYDGKLRSVLKRICKH